jgi:putative sigma-54 modulation protein
MNIIISGRHFTVSTEMKQDIENRLLEILNNKSLKISTVRVVLTLEKNRFNAEIIVNLKNHDIETIVEKHDLEDALGEALDKIDVQVRRYLDKAQNHHHDNLATIAASGNVATSDDDDDDDDYEME